MRMDGEIYLKEPIVKCLHRTSLKHKPPTKRPSRIPHVSIFLSLFSLAAWRKTSARSQGIITFLREEEGRSEKETTSDWEEVVEGGFRDRSN